MARKKGVFNRMPDAELIVMQALWDAEKAGFPESHAGALIQANPETLGGQKLTTVLTLLTRLTDRGYVTCEKDGRANLYSAAISEEEYRKLAAKDFVQNVCRQSTGSLLSALVAGGLVEDGDIEELRALLAKETAEKEGKA